MRVSFRNPDGSVLGKPHGNYLPDNFIPSVGHYLDLKDGYDPAMDIQGVVMKIIWKRWNINDPVDYIIIVEKPLGILLHG